MTSGPATGPAQPLSLPPEQYRERRGHDFYPDPEALAAIPALYASDDTPAADQIMHLHYTGGLAEWYVSELDPSSGLAFGWARISNGEWGSISLAELEQVTYGGGLIVRDLAFTPTRAGDIPAIASGR
ncbi:DUF2958 domain-containing protein [Streptomyces sp. NPDC088354]|uniref:DUF2958 domain-containing protein n=1 Tax=Streptomyces sp. NPDC088354 TaxID=3365856 RepID=UPI003823C2F7